MIIEKQVLKNISNFKIKIVELYDKKIISKEDKQTILECVRIPILKEQLLSIKETTTLFRNIVEHNDEDSLEKIRLLCQGIWLEETNGFAVDIEGNLLVKYNQGELQISPQLKEKTCILHRQAIMRQIERIAVFEQNSISTSNPKTVLDIGAGTLIGTTMIRTLFPKSKIDALEPGYVSQKSKNISQKLEINLIQNSFSKFKPQVKYDLIIMHFVLEHSIKEAKELIRFAIKNLSKKGKISICVPNFNSFHREFETHININKRDMKSRLSLHDSFSGHQTIFSKIDIEKIIKDVENEEHEERNVHFSTILPRPFAFNIIAGFKKHKTLSTMHKNGHIKGMSEKGSVLCITIGNSPEHLVCIESNNLTTKEFKEIIETYLDTLKKHKSKQYLKVIDFLQRNYPNLINGHQN
jgi:trans-aconitate methyltransferase